MRHARIALIGFLFVASLLGTKSALADSDFSFSYAGSGIAASGILVTTPQLDGSFLITALSGTQNGQTMSLLAPLVFAGNDNLLFPGAPQLDFGGFSFVANGIDYNVYFNSIACCGGGLSYFVTTTPGILGTLVNFSATPASEPGSLSLLVSALGLAGLMLVARRSL